MFGDERSALDRYGFMRVDMYDALGSNGSRFQLARLLHDNLNLVVGLIVV
jgi:hypothetical protein